MALEAIRENLDGLTEDEKKHYTEKEGKFCLDVITVNGTSLEDVTGLKKTLEKIRTNERDLTKKLEALQTKFKDIDPEEARNALGKIDEIKNWDGDRKITEAVEATKRELAKQHTKIKEQLEEDLTDAQEQLTDALVNTKIVEALQKEQGNIDLLLPHVKRFVRMVRNSEGRFYPEVISENGDPRVGDSDGSPMTVHQLVLEMKTQKTFAAAFPGANATGSGGGSSSESGTQKKTGGGKTIAASDGKAMSTNLEDIASGKTVVDMSK
jgi:hypothetical protein